MNEDDDFDRLIQSRINSLLAQHQPKPLYETSEQYAQELLQKVVHKPSTQTTGDESS
jgi:hypothetical protein